MAENILEVRDLNIYDREGRALVKGIDLSLKEGGSLGIVGESGSGKTLTLKSLIGLLPEGLTDSARYRFVNGRMGMIFQNPQSALDPLTPVAKQLKEVYLKHHGESCKRVNGSPDNAENLKTVKTHPGFGERMLRAVIGEAALKRPGNAADEAAEKWMRSVCERLSLPEETLDGDRYPRTFSGGQCQRISIAMALASEPQILLCDEPTTALDVSTQKNTISLIKSLQQEYGFAIIFVTHNLLVAAELCSRLAVMRDGLIAEEGTAEKILTAPEHPYTRMLAESILTVPKPDAAKAQTV